MRLYVWRNIMSTKEELRNLLKGYRVFTPKMKKVFKKFGITVIRKSNHIILEYIGFDGNKYHSIMSKTCGDTKHAGLNLAAEIAKRMGV